MKDSIFRDLFKNPEYALQLYRVLHPEDTEVSVENISNVNVENVLLDQMYNDLGFMVREKLLVMTEAQASWSVNVIVRLLLYLSETWHQYIVATKQNRYGTKRLKLPQPELYVIYTGERKVMPEILSLSEEFFGGSGECLEVNVRVLYGDGKDDIISQYVTFTKLYDDQIRTYGRTKKAVLETIRICRDQDVLKDYLESREKEVVDIMMALFDQETALEAYLEEYAEKVRAESELKAKKETALKMKEKGYPDGTIAELLEVGVSAVRQWLTEETVKSNKK